MQTSSSQAFALRRRFMALGLDQSLAGQITALISRWVERSGPEWTVQRLKRFKTNFVRSVGDMDCDWTGIATKVVGPSRKVVPKGPLGVLWKNDILNSRKITKALNALMVYSTFKAEHVTPTQWKKFRESAERPPTDPSALAEVQEWIRVPKSMRVREVTPTSFEEFVVSRSYSAEKIVREVESFIDSDVGQYVWETYPVYRKMFLTSLGRHIDARIRFDDYLGVHPPLTLDRCAEPVGVLGTTQEPGYKLRVYASPNIVHQCAMLRMKKQLFDLLREIRWDCTYDQTSGIVWAKEQLNQGKKVYSVDLSDATNNFPVALQRGVLSQLGCSEEDINLFMDLSVSAWKPTHDNGESLVRWSVGQPLGLGPSFPAFAITHGILVYSIGRKLDQHADNFRVLGDDIVISNEAVAWEYISTLEKLGIPISKDKTLTSTSVAEFAGMVVTKDEVLVTPKWRVPSDESFIDLLGLIGPGWLPFLPERQRRVAEIVMSLPEPIGKGWNPKGIPLSERVEALLELESMRLPENRVFVNPERMMAALDLTWKEKYLRGDWGVDASPIHSQLAHASVTRGRPVLEGISPSVAIQSQRDTTLRVAEDVLTKRDRTYLRKRGFVEGTISGTKKKKYDSTLRTWERKLRLATSPMICDRFNNRSQ